MTMSQGRTLAELYDADLARRDRAVVVLRPRVFIPHPLIGVEYADGALIDTTAGHVRCSACAVGRPCRERKVSKR